LVPFGEGTKDGGVVAKVDLTGLRAEARSGRQNSDTIHNRIFSTDRSSVGGGLPCWRGHAEI
jgi:hypothetical protein